MARFAHDGDMGFQKAALAETTGSRKPDRNPIGSGMLQSLKLSSAVDEMGAGKRALVDERIHRT